MFRKTIQHFQILEQIGKGGMGEVYRALDTKLQRVVAVKLLPASRFADVESRRRFIQEAQAASALNHPNIVTVHDVLTSEDTYLIAMEYVQGKPLDRLIPDTGMPIKDALPLAIQIADAIAAAHAAGIIHRDLKPSNILVRESGLAKVLDFGLAKFFQESASDALDRTRTLATTADGAIVGTPSYMSPEQVEGRKLDGRSDIFSFGSVLAEMITGQRAFPGGSTASTISAVLRDDPKWPETHTGKVPLELERIVKRCLRKDPERRYQSMKDVKNALEEVREEADHRRLLSVLPRSSRRRKPIAILSAVLALVLTLIGVTGWYFRSSPPPRLTLEMTQLTDTEASIDPAISPDGKLVAYSSDRAGDAGLDIWVQQLTARAQPIRLTHDPGDELGPSFSPDGNTIAFASSKDGGGIYVMPALGGEARLLMKGGYTYPRFSPGGQAIVVTPRLRLVPDTFIIPLSGQPPRRLVDGFYEVLSPIWSPDSRYILFWGGKTARDSDWWIVPAEGGDPSKLEVRKFFPGEYPPAPAEWLGDYVLFSQGDLQRIKISSSSPWRLIGPPESLTSSPGFEGSPRAIHHPGRPNDWMVVFTDGIFSEGIWELPIDHNRAAAAPERARQLFAGPDTNVIPSLSADGTRMTYVRFGLEGPELHARDLNTQSDRLLLRFDSFPRARLSPDGTVVAFNRQMTNPDADIELVNWSGGEPSLVCGKCGRIYEWAPASSRILYRSGSPLKFYDFDIRTSNKRLIAGDSKHGLDGAAPSPDGRWLALHYEPRAAIRPLFLAPASNGIAAPSDQWRPLIDGPGTYQRPWWSPDGSVLYFLADTGGAVNLWSQKLSAGNKAPTGAPNIVYGPPAAKYSMPAHPSFGPALGRGKLLFTMRERKSNIWLGE